MQQQLEWEDGKDIDKEPAEDVVLGDRLQFIILLELIIVDNGQEVDDDVDEEEAVNGDHNFVPGVILQAEAYAVGYDHAGEKEQQRDQDVPMVFPLVIWIDQVRLPLLDALRVDEVDIRFGLSLLQFGRGLQFRYYFVIIPLCHLRDFLGIDVFDAAVLDASAACSTWVNDSVIMTLLNILLIVSGHEFATDISCTVLLLAFGLPAEATDQVVEET